MTWLIVDVQCTLKSKQNRHDQSDRMQSTMKKRQDNDVTNRTYVTDHTSVISIEYDT